MDLSKLNAWSGASPAWLRNKRMHTVFYGDHGLRSGWRLVIFALLFGVATRLEHPIRFQLFRILHTLTGFRPQRGVDSPEIGIIGHWPHFLVLFVACWAMARFEGCELGDYGLRMSRISARSFAEGCGLGLVTMASVVCSLWSIHAYSFGTHVLHGTAALKAGVLWGVAFLGVSLNEEYFFRGFVQRTLTRGVGFLPTAVVLSGIFAWFHTGNDGETMQGIVAVFCNGMVFAFIVHRSQTLWLAVGFHLAFDWGQSFLFGVADSGSVAATRLFAPAFHASSWVTGGSAGPEASVPAFLASAAIVGYIALRFPARPDDRDVQPSAVNQPA